MKKMNAMNLTQDLTRIVASLGDETEVRIAIHNKYSSSMSFNFDDELMLAVVGTATINGKVYLLADEPQAEGE